MSITACLPIITLNINGLNALIKRQMDKDIVAIHKRILLGHKKEWNLTICNNMDVPRRYHVKWNVSQSKTNAHWFYLYEESKKKPHKVNEETKQEQTHRCREQTGGCKMGEGLGSSMRKVKGFTSTNWQWQNSHGDVKHGMGNAVSHSAITMYGARWVLDLSGDPFISYINV